MAKILTTAFMRDLEAKVTRGEITYSRMLELIEEKVLEGRKTPKDHISKADLLAQIETTGNAMKGVAYNEGIGEVTRKQAYDRFAALEWLKDWVPHLANMSNAENGHIKAGISEAARNIGQYENAIVRQISLNTMEARCSKCSHKWNIELPAIYKETFCPKCGE